MAARGYLLLLGCILANVPLELARLPEGSVISEAGHQQQPSQVSIIESRTEHPPRLHGGRPKKVPPFREAEQQQYNPMQLRRRRRGSRILYPVGDEEVIIDEDAMAGHKEFYLPRPPSRMHPHFYEDPIYHEEEHIRGGPREVIIPESSFGVTPHIYQGPNHLTEDLVLDMNGESRSYNRMPHYESFEEMFTDLQDEKIRQADKHHTNTGHAHHHAHNHKVIEPVIEHNNYWIVGQRRFRMIIIIILAVIVGIIILLILAWFFCPRKFVKKIRSKK
uniref:uncharacterized protein isoform X2 n=1 Tax=Pristiophorus japonicus TaxID=55135 RepID=UPI00398E5412